MLDTAACRSSRAAKEAITSLAALATLIVEKLRVSHRIVVPAAAPLLAERSLHSVEREVRMAKLEER